MSKLMLNNKKLFKKGGSPLLIEKKNNNNNNNNNQYGFGNPVVLLENKKEDLMVGSGVVFNQPTNVKRKPLRLNI